MENFEQLTTEQQNAGTRHLDVMSSLHIVEQINQEDLKIAGVITTLMPVIAEAVEIIVASLKMGGRLFYVGAGSSGRLGILDASECPPTFGTDPGLVQGIIAGGPLAFMEAVEGAEDNEQMGMSDLQRKQLGPLDTVVGISASGRTPYAIGAMGYARSIGAKVVGISNNHPSVMADYADIMIEAVVGPEVLLGSTRMKAGTAQKMILNMLTTAAMIRLGKVYDNIMVDLNPSNEKLVYRAKRTIQMVTGVSEEQAEKAYYEADAHVKTAIVMLEAGVGREEARRRLDRANGFVRGAIKKESAGS